MSERTLQSVREELIELGSFNVQELKDTIEFAKNHVEGLDRYQRLGEAALYSLSYDHDEEEFYLDVFSADIRVRYDRNGNNPKFHQVVKNAKELEELNKKLEKVEEIRKYINFDNFQNDIISHSELLELKWFSGQLYSYSKIIDFLKADGDISLIDAHKSLTKFSKTEIENMGYEYVWLTSFYQGYYSKGKVLIGAKLANIPKYIKIYNNVKHLVDNE